MEPDKHERANAIVAEVKRLKTHRDYLRKESTKVSCEENPPIMRRYFITPGGTESNMNYGYSTSPNGDHTEGRSLSLSAQSNYKLYDEFIGGWEEFQSEYFLRLDNKIAALEKEYTEL